MHRPGLMSAWARGVLLLFICPLDGSLGIEVMSQVKGSVHPSGSSFSPGGNVGWRKPLAGVRIFSP